MYQKERKEKKFDKLENGHTFTFPLTLQTGDKKTWSQKYNLSKSLLLHSLRNTKSRTWQRINPLYLSFFLRLIIPNKVLAPFVATDEPPLIQWNPVPKKNC